MNLHKIVQVHYTGGGSAHGGSVTIFCPKCPLNMAKLSLLHGCNHFIHLTTLF